MKTIIAAALAVVSLAASSAAIASPASGGHYEWRSAPQSGPNKSNLPNMRRVWVPDAAPAMAMDHSKMTADCAAMPCCGADQARSG